MSKTLELDVHPQRRGHGGRQSFGHGPAPTPPPRGRVPRVARLMALAISLDERLQRGELRSQSEIASLAGITRARVTQILNLLNLAPDIQESILFLPAITQGRDPLILHDLQPLAAMPNWKDQRHAWPQLLKRKNQQGE